MRRETVMLADYSLLCLQICNMLRKKHEEAKELLVRAVVNNNKLLLLNHPIYEEKISLLLNYCHTTSFSQFSILYFKVSCVCLHPLEHTQGSEIRCWIDDEESPNRITIRQHRGISLLCVCTHHKKDLSKHIKHKPYCFVCHPWFQFCSCEFLCVKTFSLLSMYYY